MCYDNSIRTEPFLGFVFFMSFFREERGISMPRALKILIIGMFINVTGASFLWPLNTIYIHNHLGKSLTVAGLVLMLNSGASVAGNLCGGFLFDKIGGFKSIMLGIGITLASLMGLVFFHEWPAYIVLLTIVGFGSGVVFPASYAMAGSVWPEGEGRHLMRSMLRKTRGWPSAQRLAVSWRLSRFHTYFWRMLHCIWSFSLSYISDFEIFRRRMRLKHRCLIMML